MGHSFMQERYKQSKKGCFHLLNTHRITVENYDHPQVFLRDTKPLYFKSFILFGGERHSKIFQYYHFKFS